MCVENMEQKKIKILFISHESNIGGSTVSLVSLIQGLKEITNIDVTVLLPCKKGIAINMLKNYDIKYKRFLYRGNYKRISEKYLLKYYLFDLVNIFAVKIIRHYMKKEKFDIICSNSTAVDVGARAVQRIRIPHIYYVREFMEADHNIEYRNKEKMRKLLEKANYVIFISKAIEAYYKVNFKTKNTVQFFNGFIINDYYIKEHNILNYESISFVQVGTCSDGKGTLNTIEMLHCLSKKGINNWNMEFVGRGSDQYIEKMKTLIADYHLESKITIKTFSPDIKEILSKKDILIMNSNSEGFGRVTVEGMLAGCLVVGRYSGGTIEILQDKINGVTYYKDEDFLNSIWDIINDREKYRRIAKEGQKYALEHFDCKKTAENFMLVVEACLK